MNTNNTPSYILAFDHGTTGIKACVIDHAGQSIARGYEAFEQIYPHPGWVEHDANTLWQLTLPVAEQALSQAKISWENIAAIGITNQRETTVLWDSLTGEPVYNAIVWQCRRTADFCRKLKDKGLERQVIDKTGLLLDPYFSATKIHWIMQNVPKAKELLQLERLMFGTIDTWIIWNLTGKKEHVTDTTNASRTLLYHIHEKKWDPELLKLFDVPQEILPKVKSSKSDFGKTDSHLTGGYSIPIGSAIGDQQSALYGQKCWEKGEAKSTFGTGAFIVMNLGDSKIQSPKGLLTTLACNAVGEASYASEGSIFMAGATLNWLQNQLKVIDTPSDADKLANSLTSNDGVYLVPAFAGLGAPYWDPDAKGLITGITQSTTSAHFARAAFEAMAYQTWEVIKIMVESGSMEIRELKVDGGVTRSDFFMQFLTDILNITVTRTDDPDITAKGSAFLAGLQVKFWSRESEIKKLTQPSQSFHPNLTKSERNNLIEGWKCSVKKALS